MINRLAALDLADGNSLSLLSSRKYLDEFRNSQAGAVLIADSLADEPGGPAVRIAVADPSAALLQVARALEPQRPAVAGIHPSVTLGHGVVLGQEVSLGPRCVIGARTVLGDRVSLGPAVVLGEDVVVADDTILEAGVVVYRDTRIGRRVLIQSGTVVGGAGFGFHAGEQGAERIPHLGGCIIEDDVEIGSNSCIDRGSVDDTVVGAGTKIDNLVQVGHNVRIGRHCLIASGVGIGGSCRLGNGVVLAGQAGLAGHLSIGDGARIGAQAGVVANIPPSEDWSGTPARPLREWMRAVGASYRLGPLARQIQSLIEEQE